MKKVNKGMMITGTFAAALMACSMVSCSGKVQPEIQQTANTFTAELAAPMNETAVTTAAKAPATTAAKKAKTAPTTTEAAKTEAVKNEAAVSTAPAASAPAKPAATTAPVKTASAPAQTTAAPAANVAATDIPSDKYTGTFYEQCAGRGNMTVTKNADSTYSVHLAWSSGASESSTWDFSGSFDKSGILYYSNCTMKTTTSDANGNSKTTDNYTAGSGTLSFDGAGYILNDNMGNITPNTRFSAEVRKFSDNAKSEAAKDSYVPCPGAAGCRYYENEKCFMTGTFLDRNGSRVRLDIAQADDGRYDCTVTAADIFGSYYVWGFMADYADGDLVYDRGALSYITYDGNGAVTDNKIVSDVHAGGIRSTAAGLEWTDSDGTSYVFVK